MRVNTRYIDSTRGTFFFSFFNPQKMLRWWVKAFSHVGIFPPNSAGTAVLNFFPLLKHLPGDLFNYKKVISNTKVLHSAFLRPQVESHRNRSPDDNRRDFISLYLQQIHELKGKGQTTSIDGTLSSVLFLLLLLFISLCMKRLGWGGGRCLYCERFSNCKIERHFLDCDAISLSRIGTCLSLDVNAQ